MSVKEQETDESVGYDDALKPELDLDEPLDPGPEKLASIDIHAYDREGRAEYRKQWIIKELPITLYLNGREVVTLLCAGHHLDELAVGFFRAEGFLKTPQDLLDLKVDEEAGRVDITTRTEVPLLETMWEKRTVTSGCGKGSLFYFSVDALLSKPVVSDMTVTPEQIVARVEDLHHLSETYRHTHGVHNSVLATADRTLIFREDIGRHNAVDMIVGHLFLRGIPLYDKMVVTTGRLTSEILIKAAKVGIPILVSRNAATSLSIELARSLQITLIGYARAGKFHVYSGNERIVASPPREVLP